MTNQLRAYIDAWRRNDVLTADCTIIESYGPVYRGRQRIEQWMRTWLDAGGTIGNWTITTEAVAGDTVMAEWIFSCIWQGKPTTFDGATIARLDQSKIAYLREYATTAPLYDWTGTWKT